MNKKVLAISLIIGGLLIAAGASHAFTTYDYESNIERLREYLRRKYYIRGKTLDNLIKLIPYIVRISKKYGIDPAITLSVIIHESRGNPHVVSSVGAIGLMQIMPGTARQVCGLSPEELYDPYKNIECGVKYLAYLKKHSKDLYDMYIGYYAGLGGILRRRATGRIPKYGNPPVDRVVYEFYSMYKEFKPFFEV